MLAVLLGMLHVSLVSWLSILSSFFYVRFGERDCIVGICYAGFNDCV